MDIYIHPLLEIDSELAALDYLLNLIENEIRNKKVWEERLSQKKIKKRGLTPDDPEWHYEKYELDYIIEFLLPRLFRGPFLVSLYAVYESAVTEVANLIQKQKTITISINDNKKTFNLDRAKDYYKHILEFQLYSDNREWEKIKMLSVVRHAIAHKNGRIKMLNNEAKQKIFNWEKQDIGISSIDDYIVLEERFLRDTLESVKTSLNNLVKRWDDTQTSS